MKINYGLWWHEEVNGKKKEVRRNFSIEHEMDWDNMEDHNAFRQMILAKHPGTHIHGYALAEPSGNDY